MPTHQEAEVGAIGTPGLCKTPQKSEAHGEISGGLSCFRSASGGEGLGSQAGNEGKI